MTDSPLFRLPLDPQEKPIFEKVLQIRNSLELIKQDKSCFMKSCDVGRLYDETLDQVHALNSLRTNKRDEQNQVDKILDDCFQLISLAFMAIGKNNEAPAMYSVVSTITRLLSHLKECAFYSNKDLEDIERNLKHYRETMSENKDCLDPHLFTLLEARLNICQNILSELKGILSHLTPDLAPTYEKLVSILRTLSACNVRTKFPKEEVRGLHAQLKKIQQQMQEDVEHPETLSEEFARKLHTSAESAAADPKRLVTDLLTRCTLWVELMEEHPGMINENFKETFDKLLAIRNNLESRAMLQAWSMRETDLYSFQRQLDRIDESRSEDGNFVDGAGVAADLQTQRTLLYLLRKSYALIYKLLTTSEPVSEALLPIYSQLKTLRKCLREVKKAGGVSSPRELYPYSMKLSSIDNMRVDGKFMVNNAVPDGQTAAMELLESCFELVEDLTVQAEEDNSEVEKD